MDEGWHVSANDIRTWTHNHKKDAEAILPLLVKKLIFATINPLQISMPWGDGIASPGWDGILSIPGNDDSCSFIPSGDSRWEFGTDEIVNSKANSDYLKRTKNPDGVNKKKTTFVFVTSRLWTKRTAWVDEKKIEKKWKNVKGINAADLETWLSLCPPVHRWFAIKIGKITDGNFDIESAWDAWKSVTTPSCIPLLVIAGRVEEYNKLIFSFQKPHSLISVAGQSKDEAYAFILASIVQNKLLSSKFLLIQSKNDWNRIISTKNSLILYPEYNCNPEEIALAIKNNHWVINALIKTDMNPDQEYIRLSNPKKSEQIKALIEMGFDSGQSEAIVDSSRGMLNLIRRNKLLSPVEVKNPQWVNSQDSKIILAAFSAGSWDKSNKNDCDKISELAGVSYDHFEQELERISQLDDSPIQCIGDVWHIITPQDTWFFIHKFFKDRNLERLISVAGEVIGELDPAFELKPEERWIAQLHNKKTKYSKNLKKGICLTLALIASDEYIEEPSKTQIKNKIDYLVSKILSKDCNPEQWYSIRSFLPLLSEVSPDIFLDAIEGGLKNNDLYIMELFRPEGYLGRSIPVDLLWALECVSWNLDYLSRVSKILMSLPKKNPDGNFSDMPINSLHQIYLGWYPQTKATPDQKLSIIDMLLEYDEKATWEFLLKLIYKSEGAFANPIYHPKFRNWSDDWSEGTTNKNYQNYVQEISNRISDHIEKDLENRWIKLISQMDQFSPISLPIIIKMLKKVDFSVISEKNNSVIKNELRKKISFYQKYRKDDNSKKNVTVLKNIYKKIDLKNPIYRNLYLFENVCPTILEIPSGLDYHKQQESIGNYQRKALEEILSSQGIDGLKNLATSVNNPAIIGRVLESVKFSSNVENELLNWLSSNEISLNILAKSYISTRGLKDKKWFNSIMQKKKDKWPSQKIASFFTCVPIDKKILKTINSMDIEAKSYYWKTGNFSYLEEDESDCANIVLDNLIQYGRPLAAVFTAGQYLIYYPNIQLNIDTLLIALEKVGMSPEDIDDFSGSNIRYQFSKIFDYLKKINLQDESKLTQIEWLYLDYYSSEEKPIRLITKVLKEPDFFVQLICMQFKSDPKIDDEFENISPEKTKYLALKAHELLNLVDQIPGINLNGSVSTEFLEDWVLKAMEGCAQKNRKVIGEHSIGQVLSHSPIGNDGFWPHEAVRKILEKISSQEIEDGMENGVYNSRGALIKLLEEGGEKEREIAQKYRTFSDAIKFSYPRTSRMLKLIINTFYQEGVREDLRTQLLLEGIN